MTMFSRAKDESRRFVMKDIHGDCLERIGVHIPHGGFAIIDKNCEVKVGDLVHCSNVLGALTTYVKQVKEVGDDTIIVGTAYADSTKDFTFEAAEIFGVVTEVYCKVRRNRVYHREETTNY